MTESSFAPAGASLVAQLVENPPAVQETCCSIPGLGRSPGGGKGHPLQWSGLEDPMDCPRGRKDSDTTKQLSHSFPFTFAPALYYTKVSFSDTRDSFLISKSISVTNISYVLEAGVLISFRPRIVPRV